MAAYSRESQGRQSSGVGWRRWGYEREVVVVGCRWALKASQQHAPPESPSAAPETPPLFRPRPLPCSWLTAAHTGCLLTKAATHQRGRAPVPESSWWVAVGTSGPPCAPKLITETWDPAGRPRGPCHIPGPSRGVLKLAGTPRSETRMRRIPKGLGFRLCSRGN